LVRSAAGEQVLRDALGRLEDRTLSPRNPAIAIDRHYVLAAAGLLADVDRDAAMRLVRGALLGEDADRMPARIDR
ncbi:MAG TPA: glutamate mutase L, partial [Solirubrobacteraceae bacterium]